jgi:hypothetical protein
MSFGGSSQTIAVCKQANNYNRNKTKKDNESKAKYFEKREKKNST